MKLRAVFRFIRETNNSLLIILPGLLFSLGLAQFAMILFVFFQSPKANLLLLAIVVLNLLIFSLFIVFIIHIIGIKITSCKKKTISKNINMFF